MVEFVLRDLAFFGGESTEFTGRWGTLDTDVMLDLVNIWGVGVGWARELGKTG